MISLERIAKLHRSATLRISFQVTLLLNDPDLPSLQRMRLFILLSVDIRIDEEVPEVSRTWTPMRCLVGNPYPYV